MTPTPDPAEALRLLWSQGQQPTLSAFLRDAGPLPLAKLAEVVRLDQRRRWQDADPLATACPVVAEHQPNAAVWAEAYFQQFPELQSDPEVAVDLIFNEFLVRDKLGHAPTLEEYVRRFPAHAAVLKDQVDLHRALAAQSTDGGNTLAGHAAARTNVGSPPEIFGRYRIKKLLGEGGMGSVYLAEDTQLQRSVALKVPRFLGNDQPELVARFHREARIAATFHHPNLCPVYDVGQFEGIHYLTMPFLTGTSLAAWLKSAGPVPIASACRLACLIARAVHVAHQAGVLHRDLKPANIMLADGAPQDGPEPVVMDFGLARRGDAQDPRLTGTGVVIGTGLYMPPEQIAGDAALIGPSADVYSLGVILYEMLTGRTPFQGQLHEVLRAVLSQAPPTPRQFRPDLPAALEAVCLKALAKDPADRFRSMADFAAALEPFVSTPKDAVKTECVPAVVAIDVRVPARGKKALGVFVIAVGLASVLLCVTLWYVLPPLFSKPDAVPGPKDAVDVLAKVEEKDSKPQKTPNKKAEDKKEKKPDDKQPTKSEDKKPEGKKDGATKPDKATKPALPAVLKGHRGVVRALAFNPKDPDQLASGSDDGDIRVWQIAADMNRVFKGNHGAVLALAFSPDGKRLASSGGDEKKLTWDVLIWDVAGANTLGKFKGHFFLVASVAFSSDGKTLASAGGDNTIRLWDAETLKEEEIKRFTAATFVKAVAFNPKAKMLASAASSDSTVQLWDITTGKNTLLKGHKRDVLAVAFSPDGRLVASAGEDQTIKLWEVSSGKNTATLEGHKGAVNAIAFNHDGAMLVSGSADHTVQLWDVRSAKSTATFEGHEDEIHAVAFSPDGRTVASASKDKTVRRWNVPTAGK